MRELREGGSEVTAEEEDGGKRGGVQKPVRMKFGSRFSEHISSATLHHFPLGIGNFNKAYTAQK